MIKTKQVLNPLGKADIVDGFIHFTIEASGGESEVTAVERVIADIADQNGTKPDCISGGRTQVKYSCKVHQLHDTDYITVENGIVVIDEEQARKHIETVVELVY